MTATAQAAGMDALLTQQGLTKLFLWGTRTVPFHWSSSYDPTTVWPNITHLDLTTRGVLGNGGGDGGGGDGGDGDNSDQAQQMTTTTTVLLLFLQSHPHLDQLCFHGGALSKAVLDAIIKYLPNISDLGFYGHHGIASQDIRRLIQGCPRLERVNLRDSAMMGKDFPEMKPFIYYKGDTFDQTKINCLYGEALDIIRARGQTPLNGSSTS
ncbi:hypothetical protein BCR42DRAFT_421290, partial [Absidia repens]